MTAAGDRRGVAQGPGWDGETVTWPEGPKLPGITEQLLTAGLHRIGAHTRTRPVRLDELAGFQAAFAAYSWCPSQPLAAVDGLAYANPPAAYALLDEAWAAVPWQQV